MTENGEACCHHYLTQAETALSIALPCASVILTLGINEWVIGLQKSFNLCHCELRRSNGFCFSNRPDKAFQFIQSEKSNYHLISLNGSSEPIFQNIWWEYFWHSLHDSLLWLESTCGETKKRIFSPVSSKENGHKEWERIRTDRYTLRGPIVNTNVIMKV